MKWLLVSTLKRYAIPALSLLLVAGAGGGFWFGKQTERTAQELRTAQTLLRAAREAERIRAHDLALAFEARDRETRIVERVRTVRVDVPAADCRDLGADWVREANKAAAAASARGVSGGLHGAGDD